MLFLYISVSISVVFMSFILGMLLTGMIRKTSFYQTTLSHLNFIPNDTVNTVIGVGLVRWVVRNTFFRFFNQNIKIDRKLSSAYLHQVRSEMTKAEIDHLFGFLLVSVFVIVQLVRQEYMFAFVVFVFNVFMNLHPLLIQQQNKRRLDPLINRFSQKER